MSTSSSGVRSVNEELIPTTFPLFQRGELIDNRYIIGDVLGEGGMGIVYRARRTLGGEVAIKVLRPEFARRQTMVDRFRREARTAARIDHDNVVRIYEDNMDRGHGVLPYLVMELLKGTTLRHILIEAARQAPGRLELWRAVRLMEEICDGVAAAHCFVDEDGKLNPIVHRDLKPENVIILPPRRAGGLEAVKVVDFGIAKIREVDRNLSNLISTDVGVRMGSREYMSPEQCEGKKADIRSDVYSLGVMLYELLAGSRPFYSENDAGYIKQHVYDNPPPLPEGVEVPDEIFDVALHALAKDPARRPPDAGELLKELQDAKKTAVSRTAEEARKKEEEEDRKRRKKEQDHAAADARRSRDDAAAAQKKREQEKAAAEAQKKRDAEAAALRGRLGREFAEAQKQLHEQAAGVAAAIQTQFGGAAADSALQRQSEKKKAAAEAALRQQSKKKAAAAEAASKRPLDETVAAPALRSHLERLAATTSADLQKQLRGDAATAAGKLRKQLWEDAAHEAEGLRQQLEKEAATAAADFQKQLKKKAAGAADDFKRQTARDADAAAMQGELERAAVSASADFENGFRQAAKKTADELRQRLEGAAAGAADDLQRRLEAEAAMSAASLKQRLEREVAEAAEHQQRLQEQAARAAEQKRLNDEKAAAAAKKKRDDEIAAALKRKQDEEAAALKRKQDEAAAAALQRKRDEEFAARRRLEEQEAAKRRIERRKRALRVAKVLGATVVLFIVLGSAYTFARLTGLTGWLTGPQPTPTQTPTPSTSPAKSPSPKQPPPAQKIPPSLNGQHTEKVNSIAISSDGKLLASGSKDKSAIIWDLGTGREKFAFRSEHTGSITSVAFSSDDKRLATAGLDGAVLLWDTATGNLVRRLQAGSGLASADTMVLSLAFSRDGQMLAGGGSQGRVYLWNVNAPDGTPGTLLNDKTQEYVYPVIFSPDGKTLIGSANPGVVSWSLNNPRPLEWNLSTFFKRLVTSLAFSPDGGTLFVGTKNKIFLWDMKASSEEHIYTWESASSSDVVTLAVSPDGNKVVCGREDGTLELWDIRQQIPRDRPDIPDGGTQRPHKTQAPRKLDRGDRQKVRTLAFGREGNYVAGGLEDGTIRFWSISDFK